MTASSSMCEKCGLDLEVGDYPFCKGNQFDHRRESCYAGPFEAFTIEVDGGPKHFASLHEVRKYERETERRVANGQGSLTIFREFSNNSAGGRQTENVFGAPDFPKLSTRNSRGDPFVVRRGHRPEGE